MNIETLNQKITQGEPIMICHDYTIRGGINMNHLKAVEYERLQRRLADFKTVNGVRLHSVRG